MDRMNIVVTGAFGEIGDAVCGKLASSGHTVVRAGRRLPAGPKRALAGTFRDVAADLTSPDGWRDVLDAASPGNRPVDALVHCAGTLVAADLRGHSPKDLRSMLDDNILGLMLGFRALLPEMLERGRGRLIVIGSLGGIVPMPHGAVYAAVKFAVRGFTLSMAEELHGTGVKVSLLSCGPVDSRMLRAEAAVEGTIGFVNRPLDPGTVAESVVQVLRRPRREVFLPRFQALPAPLVGGYSSLFAALHPLISAAGSAGKRRYRASISRSRDAQGA